MSIHAIIGGQWGDEGKGKIVDHFSRAADVVARFQGGANAGHTVYVDDTKFVLHQIPSGILREGVRCILGTGMVIDPIALAAEINQLIDTGINCTDQIGIAFNAHLVLPVHKRLDGITEEDADERTIGTTRRGIGPAYADRHARRGVPAVLLLDETAFKDAVQSHLVYSNNLIQKVYGKNSMRLDADWDELRQARELLAPLVTDTSAELLTLLNENRNIIAEGAQGVLLDIDFGSYPYVTSSHPGTSGISSGLGIPPAAITRATGIFKAYCTRVGEGPFPTEISDQESAEKLREAGNEYGATTGRPRRCGWFDAVLARHVSQMNGFTDICLTKGDVLHTFDSVKIGTEYEHQRDNFLNLHALDSFNVRFETLPAWHDNMSRYQEYHNLPDTFHTYVSRLEELTGVPIRTISTGPERSQIIERKYPR